MMKKRSKEYFRIKKLITVKFQGYYKDLGNNPAAFLKRLVADDYKRIANG